MKIVSIRPGVNATRHLVLSVDVSKKYLDCYVRLTDSYNRILNTSPAVRTHLVELFRLARRENLSGVMVACEPSGGFERTLLEIARSLDCQCVYVSGEQVAQLRKIESRRGRTQSAGLKENPPVGKKTPDAWENRHAPCG